MSNETLHLNAEDAAIRLGVSISTFYRWVRIGKFPEGKLCSREGLPGRSTVQLWPINVVDQYAADHGIEIRIDPTLPDAEFLEDAPGNQDVPGWKNVTMSEETGDSIRYVLYVIGVAMIGAAIYAWWG